MGPETQEELGGRGSDVNTVLMHETLKNDNLNFKNVSAGCPMTGRRICCLSGWGCSLPLPSRQWVTHLALRGLQLQHFQRKAGVQEQAGQVVSLRSATERNQGRSLAPGSSTLLRLQLACDWSPPQNLLPGFCLPLM